ncbi:MAG: hypothetical protein WA733_18450 [Methylocystis sp.]
MIVLPSEIERPISPFDKRLNSFSITISAVSRPPNSSMPSIVIFQRIAVLLGVGLSCIGNR